MAKIYSGSIYFLGQYRPAYFEATGLGSLRAQMRDAIAQMNMDDWQWFAPRIDNAVKELRKPSCGGASVEHGCRGVSVAKRPHDPWLDSIVAKLPNYPGLVYPG
jgi:hypothetical protein